MTDSKRSKITPEHQQESARLKALWDDGRPHRTQAVFGEVYDLGNQANVGHYLNGRSPLNPKAAAAFAVELGCSVSDFSPRIAEELARLAEPTRPASAPAHYSEAAEPEEGYVRLPVMAEAGAGHGCEALPEVVSYIDVLESYVRRQLGANPRTIKVLTARGNSMTGQIEDGDIMFVEQTDEFTDDGIYILTLDHLVRVKRLSVSALSQQVIIESNDGRKAESLPLKDVPHRLRIQGRVVGAWSLRRFS